MSQGSEEHTAQREMPQVDETGSGASPREQEAVPGAGNGGEAGPVNFAKTLADELLALGIPPKPGVTEIRNLAYESNLVGLSFSGGGIRSATFNLGIIQGLAESDLLSRFHYLSTVSGGGYIGVWLSALTRRLMAGDIRRSESAIAEASALVRPNVLLKTNETDTRNAANAIYFLRQFSNYLAPRRRLLSGDSLAAFGTYFRNVLINQLILVLLFSAALMLPYVAAGLELAFEGNVNVALLCAGGVIAIAAPIIGFCVWEERELPNHKASIWWIRQGRLTGAAIALLLVGIFLFSIAIIDIGEGAAGFISIYFPTIDFLNPYMRPAQQNIALIFSGFYTFAWFLGSVVALVCNRLIRHRDTPSLGNAIVVLVLGAVSSLVIGGVLGNLVPVGVEIGRRPEFSSLMPWIACGVVFPLVALLFWLSLTLQTGLASRLFTETRREWWARTAGILVFVTGSWFVVCAITVIAEPIVAWGYWTLAGGGIVWVGTTIGGLAVGKSGSTKALDGKTVMDTVILLVPPIFILGFAILIAWLVHEVFSTSASTVGANSFLDFVTVGAREVDPLFTAGSWWAPLLWAFAFAALGALVGRRASINLFSLSNFYGNRLTRCYVGASTENRHANPFTGFAREDKFQFANLMEGPIGNGRVSRPLHIVNTALNLVSGKELAWQERKAASFTFTPLYAGFSLPPAADRTGTEAYVPTANYLDEGGPSMGHLLAMSGAAASPNMGYHSSPTISFLLTLFNVRLGRWCPNPSTRRGKDLVQPDPTHGWWYLFREVFGLTDESTDYVYLSDGGHFENLGLYELVRRRCKVIVVCDAGCDPTYSFEDLGNAIRKCRIDLGVEVSIDLEKIRPAPIPMGPTSLSRQRHVCGTITYPGGKTGCLIYAKASLRGNEPSDIQEFKSQHPDFPHHSTSDQFFDESTFESYRKLGQCIALEVAKECGAAIRDPRTCH